MLAYSGFSELRECVNNYTKDNVQTNCRDENEKDDVIEKAIACSPSSTISFTSDTHFLQPVNTTVSIKFSCWLASYIQP